MSFSQYLEFDFCETRSLVLAGCKQEGPAEKAGKEIDKSAQQVGVSDRCNGTTRDRKYRASDDRNYGANW